MPHAANAARNPERSARRRSFAAASRRSFKCGYFSDAIANRLAREGGTMRRHDFGIMKKCR
jgi:hypothetical protein